MKDAILIVVLLCFASSCSGFKEWTKKVMEPKTVYDEVHENHLALAKQRLIPRPGHEGKLTNQVCLKFYGAKCEKTSIMEYDIEYKSVRDKLNEFKFACQVGGKRYRICDKLAGFCRSEKECVKWGKTTFRRKKYCKEYGVKTSYLDAVKDYQFLLDGATECQQGM